MPTVYQPSAGIRDVGAQKPAIVSTSRTVLSVLTMFSEWVSFGGLAGNWEMDWWTCSADRRLGERQPSCGTAF